MYARSLTRTRARYYIVSRSPQILSARVPCRVYNTPKLYTRRRWLRRRRSETRDLYMYTAARLELRTAGQQHTHTQMCVLWRTLRGPSSLTPDISATFSKINIPIGDTYVEDLKIVNRRFLNIPRFSVRVYGFEVTAISDVISDSVKIIKTAILKISRGKFTDCCFLNSVRV